MRHPLLTVVLLGALPPAGFAQTATGDAVATTTHFAFYSDLPTNVHDTLITVATARRANRPDIFDAVEQACFNGLPAAEREAWDRAVDDYVAARSTRGQRVYERFVLAGFLRPESVADTGDRDFLRRWTALLQAPAPAYRRCRWPAQDASNRRWIGQARTLLATYERPLGERLPQLFTSPWTGLPFRVDIVNVGSFSGADSAHGGEPDTPHILISSANPSNQGFAALEAAFHEASHFLTGPDSPLDTALRTATARTGASVPPDLLHQVHFFITGEAVRRVLADHGEMYTPHLFALKLFSDRFREIIARVWLPQINGTRTLDEAAVELVRGLNTQSDK
jgi:hypothetical protein